MANFSIVESKYVFLDVVSFSSRTVEAQAIVVQSLNQIVTASLTALSVSKSNEEEVLCIPTGDGMCIVLVRKDPVSEGTLDIHVRLALEILRLLSEHNQKINEPDEAFKLRIGINENIDILVQDINDRRNIAGAGINDAARIMDLGGGNQILVGQNVYERLRGWRAYQGSFKPFNVTVKHDQKMIVYQFAPPHMKTSPLLDTSQPHSISRRERSRRESDTVPSEGLVYEGMRSLIARAQNNIVIVSTKRDWIYSLIPSIIFARVRSRKIIVVHFPDSGLDCDRGEIRLLRQLGCTVIERDPAEAASFEGTFIDVNQEFQVRGLVLTNKPEVSGFYARKLYARGDLPLLNTLLSTIAFDLAPEPDHTPSMEPASEDEVLGWMKQVPLYADCEIALIEVDVKTVRPVAPDLRLFKIHQADTIRQLLNSCGLPPYAPAAVTLKNGKKSPLLPPVLESHEGVLCIAEGHNRLYSSMGEKVTTLVVSGLPLAMQRPTSLWQAIRVDDERVNSGLSPDARAYARNIESSVHQGLY